MTTYHCSTCKLAVIVLPDRVLRPCGHDTPIVAEASAGLHGQSKVSAG